MTEEEFISIIKKAEVEAEKNINTYKMKLALFALLGYVVVFVVLVSLILLVGGTISVAFISSSLLLLLIKKKVIIMIMVAIWTFLKALWIKFDPPEGYELKRGDFPKLFAEIDHLSKELDTLKIHKVILNDELNASVVQHPKYGLLGGQENILYLGLQLLFVLSEDEMRSVLAHELGHLSGNHNRFANWIYRVRLTWQRIMYAFEESSSFGARLMQYFFNWYAPRFEAYSFVLARSNEYEADQIASKLTTPRIAAAALANIYVNIPHIEQDFWQVYFKKADEESVVPKAPYQDFKNFLFQHPLKEEEFQERLKKELEVETHYSNTHPSLKDRLDAIALKEHLVVRHAKVSAAEVWLADNYPKVLEDFNEKWHQENVQAWEERYHYVQNSKKSLNTYKERSVESLNDDELWKYALFTYEFEKESDALQLFKSYLERDDQSIGANYYIGKILYFEESEEALPYLKAAFHGEYTIEDAARSGYDLLKRHHKEKEAEAWWDEALEANQLHQAAYEERNTILVKDDFVKPEAGRQEDIEKITSKLKEHKNVKRAWLAQKVLVHNKEIPVYIVAIKPRGFYWDHAQVIEKIAKEVELEMDVFLIGISGEYRKLGKRIKSSGIQII